MNRRTALVAATVTAATLSTALGSTALAAPAATTTPSAGTPAATAPADDAVVVRDAAGDIDAPVDLLRARLARRDAVRVSLRHDELVRHPKEGAGVSIWFDTDPAQKGPEYLFLAGLFEGTDYTLVHADGWDHGKPVAMKDCFYRLRLQYAADRSKLRVDPGCLGDPEEVRVAVLASADPGEGQRRDWLDSRRAFTPWV